MPEQSNDPRFHHDDGQEAYLAQRNDPLTDVPDPRTFQERYDDDHWQPVVKPTGDHRFDSQIEEFNRQHKQRESKDHLKPFLLRLAAHLQAAKDAELETQGLVDEKAKHLASVQPLLNKIDETYQRLLDNKADYDRRDFVALQKAKRQAEAVGADLDVAVQFLAEVLAKEGAILDQRELDREAKIAALKNELAELRKSRGKSVAPQPNAVKPSFQEFWAALNEGRSDHGYTPHHIAKRKYESQYGVSE
jgi:hypothetical protein